MSEAKKIYLSGPILGCTEVMYKAWRESVKADLAGFGFEFIDPTCTTIYKEEAEHADEVFQNTIVGIAECDIVLAYIPFYSMGTSFEIFSLKCL